MSDKLNQIQHAIDMFQLDTARELLQEELKDNPSADVYFMASQAAVNHGQRMRFLEKAIDLDPFHQAAHDELASMMPAGMNNDPFATPSLRKPKAKNMPNVQRATIGKRFIAMVIDAIILGVTGGIVGAIYGFFAGGSLPTYNPNDSAYIDAFVQIQMNAMVMGLIINFAYHIYFMTRTNGQTPGKQVLRIRVVKKDGTPITWIDAVMRNIIGYTLSGMVLGLGYIWALFDNEQQSWHDKIAGTIVVND